MARTLWPGKTIPDDQWYVFLNGTARYLRNDFTDLTEADRLRGGLLVGQKKRRPRPPAS